MCVNNIRLNNRGYRPLDFSSKPFIEVRCNHCWQCQQQKSNDYSFRVLHEVLKSNVISFFVTLTYSPDYLPLLTYYNPKNEQNETISVWNREHVKRYHKRVRRALQYYFGLSSDAFKYLCTCERGSNDEYLDSHGRVRRATLRPHFHLLYLLYTSEISPVKPLPKSFYVWASDFRHDTSFVSFFQFLLSSKWIYGNVDDVSFCRDSVSATSYITKYITKNISEPVNFISPDNVISFYDKEFEDKYSRWKYSHSCQIKDFSDSSLDRFLSERPYSPCKSPKPIYLSSLSPRPFSSINLGLDWLADKSEDELKLYFSNRKQVVLPRLHGASKINLPSYYYNRVCRSTKTIDNNVLLSRPVCRHGRVFETLEWTGVKLAMKPVWNNVHGYFCTPYRKSHTITSVSELGRSISKIRSLISAHDIVIFARNYVQRKDFFKDIFSFALDCKELSIPSFLPSVDNLSVFDGILSYLSSTRIVRLLHLTVFPKFLNEVDSLIFQFINFSKVCQLYLSHLKHLNHLNVYQRRLSSVAYRNPDLFLNHYI